MMGITQPHVSPHITLASLLLSDFFDSFRHFIILCSYTALAVKFFQKPGSLARMGKLACCWIYRAKCLLENFFKYGSSEKFSRRDNMRWPMDTLLKNPNKHFMLPKRLYFFPDSCRNSRCAVHCTLHYQMRLAVAVERKTERKLDITIRCYHCRYRQCGRTR